MASNMELMANEDPHDLHSSNIENLYARLNTAIKFKKQKLDGFEKQMVCNLRVLFSCRLTNDSPNFEKINVITFRAVS